MTNTPEKMTGISLDIAADQRARLKQLFPTVFTETANEAGELVESVDFEKLKTELGTFTDLFENRRERYGMDWPGKKEALKLIQTPSTATLKPCREESVNFDTTENLFIEGDNLEVLKLLQKSYYGKVKMIYIDPPYNTGNEFIYPDNFAETLATYLEYAGLIDGEGKKFSTNTANEGRFHSKWLNMMYPRLYLARNLLRDDGVIFISIDDNEVSNLRKLCDEIFGEENFVASVVWQKRTSPDSRANLSAGHDYLLIYALSIDDARPTLNKLPLKESRIASYKNPDNDPRGPWSSENLTGQTGHATPSQFYKIETPSGTLYAPPEGRCWALAESTFLKLKADGRIWFGENGSNRPRLKRFLSESDGMMTWTWWPNDEVGHNQEATKEAKELLGAGDIFDNPKPTRLISRVVNLATGKNDLILDFFAGSCTTAHALLDLNQQDNGNRKFIMVQLPEPCSEDSEAFKAGYATIADIGKERIRRAIKKLDAEQTGKLPFGDVSPQDRGFKVLKLDKSNFKEWQPLPPDTATEVLVKQLKLFINHIDPKAGPEDLLFEILIKAGFPPSEPIETQTLAGKTVYSVSGGGLLLCLEDEVSAELINAVAEAEPMQFICLDAAFGGNDQLKANAVQTFAAYNLGKEKHNQIIFKTV
jgi:adenine-specific DNA-methyltransferase